MLCGRAVRAVEREQEQHELGEIAHRRLLPPGLIRAHRGGDRLALSFRANGDEQPELGLGAREDELRESVTL